MRHKHIVEALSRGSYINTPNDDVKMKQGHVATYVYSKGLFVGPEITEEDLVSYAKVIYGMCVQSIPEGYRTRYTRGRASLDVYKTKKNVYELIYKIQFHIPIDEDTSI